MTKIKSWHIGKTMGEKAFIYFWWGLPSNFYGRQFGKVSLTNATTFGYTNLLLGIYLVDKLAHTGKVAFVQDYSLQHFLK